MQAFRCFLGDTWTETLAYVLFWGMSSAVTGAVIVYNGKDFVDAPKLVQKEKMDWDHSPSPYVCVCVFGCVKRFGSAVCTFSLLDWLPLFGWAIHIPMCVFCLLLVSVWTLHLSSLSNPSGKIPHNVHPAYRSSEHTCGQVCVSHEVQQSFTHDSGLHHCMIEIWQPEALPVGFSREQIFPFRDQTSGERSRRCQTPFPLVCGCGCCCCCCCCWGTVKGIPFSWVEFALFFPPPMVISLTIGMVGEIGCVSCFGPLLSNVISLTETYTINVLTLMFE